MLELVYPMDDTEPNDNSLAFLNWGPGLVVWNNDLGDLEPGATSSAGCPPT